MKIPTLLSRAKPLKLFEAMVWQYTDRVVAHCECRRCGEKFSLTLHVNPEALKELPEAFIRKRVLVTADRRHSCDDEALKQDPAETNRIVNKWHEWKLKCKKGFFGEARA